MHDLNQPLSHSNLQSLQVPPKKITHIVTILHVDFKLVTMDIYLSTNIMVSPSLNYSHDIYSDLMNTSSK